MLARPVFSQTNRKFSRCKRSLDYIFYAQTRIKAETEKSNYSGHWGTSGDENFKSTACKIIRVGRRGNYRCHYEEFILLENTNRSDIEN